MEFNVLLDPYQFAYKKGYSTQTCLIRLLDDVRDAVDKRQVTIAVLFDLTKAFDTVSHRILIEKLDRIGFSNSALGWVHAYLDGRSHAVRNPNNNAVSSSVNTCRGVPQGSVLGPLLFILYLSNFKDYLTHCKYCFYADDLIIYIHCDPKEIDDHIIKVNEDIVSINDWALHNVMQLNAIKTQAIILGSARYINALDHDSIAKIVVGEIEIPYSSSVDYLGISISNTLSWDKQVTTMVRKANYALYQLKLCKNLLYT